MSGERYQRFDGQIFEPGCALPIRTDFQEISVSAPLAVAAGELDGQTPVEKRFDFSNDPIPVNATDLFIQVAYRGPLGEETDGVAVGTYDVSEPTFAAAWNNTDYFWNESNWVPHSSTYPRRGIYTYWACVGVPSRFVYRYQGATGAFAMGVPPTPGYVRLAFLFGKPASVNQRFAVRSTPIMQTSPHARVRSAFTRGQIRQANKEIVMPATLFAPFVNCYVSPPSAAEYWCSDPVQKRRGIVFGEIAQPLYYATGPNEGSDVDSVPLPAFASATLRDGGENRFDGPGALQSCPTQPAATSADIEVIERLEEEALLGLTEE